MGSLLSQVVSVRNEYIVGHPAGVHRELESLLVWKIYIFGVRNVKGKRNKFFFSNHYCEQIAIVKLQKAHSLVREVRQKYKH